MVFIVFYHEDNYKEEWTEQEVIQGIAHRKREAATMADLAALPALGAAAQVAAPLAIVAAATQVAAPLAVPGAPKKVIDVIESN